MIAIPVVTKAAGDFASGRRGIEVVAEKNSRSFRICIDGIDNVLADAPVGQIGIARISVAAVAGATKTGEGGMGNIIGHREFPEAGSFR